MLRYLLFFPAITFRLLTAEIFPWAIIYSLKSPKILKRAIPFFVVIFISVSYSLYVILFKNQEGDLLRSVIAFINPLLVYMSIMKFPEKKLSRLVTTVKYVLIFMIIWGGMQYAGILAFFEPIQQFLITRGSTEAFGLMRGVSILSSEPARAAYELLFVYACFRTTKNYDKKILLFLDFFICFYLLFIIKSALGSVMALLFMISIYRIRIILPAVIVLSIAGISIFQNIENNRTIQVVNSLATNQNTFILLMSMSGFRLISLIAAYKYAIFNPLGGGIGLWRSSSLAALNGTGVNPSDLYYFSSQGGGGFTPVRPEAYLAGVALDMGVVGITAVLVLLKPLLKYITNIKHALFPITAMFFYSLVFSGSVGNPIPWICMAISYKFVKKKENESYDYEK